MNRQDVLWGLDDIRPAFAVRVVEHPAWWRRPVAWCARQVDRLAARWLERRGWVAFRPARRRAR